MKVGVDDSDKKGVGEEDDIIIVIVIYDVIGMAGEGIRLNHFRAGCVQEF